MSYYNVDKVLEIIKSYHVFKRNVDSHIKEYSSVGVQVVDDMPKGNGITDNVANEAIRMVESDSIINEMQAYVKYVDDRLHRVKEPDHIEILGLRLNGYCTTVIGKELECSDRTIRRKLRTIARIISHK